MRYFRVCVRNCADLLDIAAMFGISAACNDCLDPTELTYVWHMRELDLRTDTSREIADLSAIRVQRLAPQNLGINVGNLHAGKRYKWILDAVPNNGRPTVSFQYEAASAYKYNMSCTAAPTLGFSGQTSFTITGVVEVEPRSQYQVHLQAHPVTYTVTTDISTVVQDSRLNSVVTSSILAGSSADNFVVPINVLAVGDDESVAVCNVDVTGADMASALIQQGFGDLLQRARSTVDSSSTPPPYRATTRNTFDKDWGSASTTDQLLRLLSLPTGDELEASLLI
uniref:PKD/REJ-like domain-containing protein n=1 Tax=Branchiostoma floridae TaxID=7739 RepID=C3XRF0_BRAFL|eukprot:XP_002613259.1 hypothetical protein BRAFLDRAFT_68224 [Branchiostoma floridae]